MAQSKKDTNPTLKCGDAQFFKLEALVPVDARGQIVLPKDVREKAEIAAGDKLAIVAFHSEGKIFCLSLMKADSFGDTVKGLLGPMMSEILQG